MGVSEIKRLKQLEDENRRLKQIVAESLHGKLQRKFRDECMNESWFMNLEQVHKIVEAWQVDYNQTRPHSSLGDLTPAEFKRQELSKIGRNL